MKKIIFFALFISFACSQFSDPPVFENSEWGPYTVLLDSQKLVGYTLELWGHEQESMFGQALRIIGPNGGVLEQFEDATIELVDSPAHDINQNGVADIIINSYSGGAHCCNSTKIYELSSNPEGADAIKIFDYVSECPAEIKDLNDDGISEIIGCDSAWAYRYCSFANSPLPTIVWTWDGEYYDIVNYDYRAITLEDAGYYFDQILNQNLDNEDLEAGEHLCATLGLSLPYLYEGREDLAYQALKLSFNEELVKDSEFNTLEKFWQDILNYHANQAYPNINQSPYGDY